MKLNLKLHYEVCDDAGVAEECRGSFKAGAKRGTAGSFASREANGEVGTDREERRGERSERFVFDDRIAGKEEPEGKDET